MSLFEIALRIDAAARHNREARRHRGNHQAGNNREYLSKHPKQSRTVRATVIIVTTA